jgi:hypothetical protein
MPIAKEPSCRQRNRLNSAQSVRLESLTYKMPDAAPRSSIVPAPAQFLEDIVIFNQQSLVAMSQQ